MKKTTVIITKIPYFHQYYFQWFLTGLYLLQDSHKINFRFSGINLFRRLSFLIKNEFICRVLYYIECQILNCGMDKRDYNLEGYVLFESGKRHFCIDCSDAPYSFDSTLLEKVDFYFKMQFPLNFNKEGFSLTPDVIIPYCDRKFKVTRKVGKKISGERVQCQNLFDNLHKIKPAMIGIRRLSYSNSKKSLLTSYKNKLNTRFDCYKGKAMCYFGSASGPAANEYSPSDVPDYTSESEIMAYFGNRLHHPNLKRSRVTSILKSLGCEYDARLISDGPSDSGNVKEHTDLIIPLEKFSEHVSKYEYNINISGYRMSIPNRFIDSFMVGTAIFTDKLSVKWYLPFDKDEVVETIPMGYLPEISIDWGKYKEDLLSLPPANRERVLELFREKWAPDIFAQYVIDTIQSEGDYND